MPVINHEYYGTTETGVNVIATPDDLAAFPKSSGTIMEGSEIAIVDGEGSRLVGGSIGRIAIHSYQNMKGYLNSRRHTSFEFEGKQFILTADYGYVIDGRVFVINRSFASEGIIKSYDLEDAVRTCSGVTDAFVMVKGDREVDLYFAACDVAVKKSVEKLLVFMFPNVRVSTNMVSAIPYSLSGKVRVQNLGACVI